MLQLVLEAVLMEGVFAEEVNGRETETSSAQTALHHLEYLGTESTGSGRQRQEISHLVNGKVLLNQRPIPGIAAINFFLSLYFTSL